MGWTLPMASAELVRSGYLNRRRWRRYVYCHMEAPRSAPILGGLSSDSLQGAMDRGTLSGGRGRSPERRSRAASILRFVGRRSERADGRSDLWNGRHLGDPESLWPHVL